VHDNHIENGSGVIHFKIRDGNCFKIFIDLIQGVKFKRQGHLSLSVHDIDNHSGDRKSISSKLERIKDMFSRFSPIERCQL
jgi:hypothetical protein